MTIGRDPTQRATDPDVDMAVPAQRTEMRYHAGLIAVVAAGGTIGALVRYQALQWWPARPGHFDWTIWTVNVAGSLLIGFFMVLAGDTWSGHSLLRPFVATGILGGFTTFSTYAGISRELLVSGDTGTAITYLAATPLVAVLATAAAAATARRLLNHRSNK